MTVHITRYRYRTRLGETWAYNYTVDGGPRCQYGTGLSSLRALIRLKYPDATATTGWS